MSLAEEMMKTSFMEMDKAKRKLESIPRWRFLKRAFLQDEIRFWRRSSLAYSRQVLSNLDQEEN